MTVAEYIALGSLALNFLIAVAGSVWGVSTIRTTVAEEIAKHKMDVTQAISSVSHSAMENTNALRAHVQRIEIWVRDELNKYVSKDTFRLVIEETRAGIHELGADLKTRLTRIEDALLKPRGHS